MLRRLCLVRAARAARAGAAWPLRAGPTRGASHLVPPTQYDIPLPNRLKLTYACVKYWEIIPIVITSMFSLSLTASYCIYMTLRKVDVTYTHRRGDNPSRTMDLRNPRCYKMITVNQLYRPWPEMQDSLDAIRDADKRLEASIKQSGCGT